MRKLSGDVDVIEVPVECPIASFKADILGTNYWVEVENDGWPGGNGPWTAVLREYGKRGELHGCGDEPSDAVADVWASETGCQEEGG